MPILAQEARFPSGELLPESVPQRLQSGRGQLAHREQETKVLDGQLGGRAWQLITDGLDVVGAAADGGGRILGKVRHQTRGDPKDSEKLANVTQVLRVWVVLPPFYNVVRIDFLKSQTL